MGRSGHGDRLHAKAVAGRGCIAWLLVRALSLAALTRAACRGGKCLISTPNIFLYLFDKENLILASFSKPVGVFLFVFSFLCFVCGQAVPRAGRGQLLGG